MTISISRSAVRLRLAVFALIIILALLYGAARLGLDLGRLRFDYRHHPTTDWNAFAADVSMALLGVSLFRLTQMLRAIADGDYFSPTVVRRFRGFAFWLLLMAIIGAAAPIILALLNRPPGAHPALTLPLDVRELLTVGITLVLFLLARLLERARAIDEEMREIV